jgi:hypothetical protein
MPYPATTYITQLRALQTDLDTVMTELSSDACFETANKIAMAASPLIAGEIGRLQKAQVKLNPSDPTVLRNLLEQLRALMKEEDKDKFADYIAMLDSLISDGVSG